jgi:site-specific recombinase XerC
VHYVTHFGVRVSELVDLEMMDITLMDRKGKLRVRAGKGEKQRVLPLNNTVRKSLQAWFDMRPETDQQKVFISQRGAIKTRAVQTLLVDLGKNARISKMTPHMARHTFGRPFGRLVNASRDATRWQKRVFSPWQGNAPRSVVLVSFQGTRASCAG